MAQAEHPPQNDGRRQDNDRDNGDEEETLIETLTGKLKRTFRIKKPADE